MIKKRSLLIGLASFLCFSTIIGTGFSAWIFEFQTEFSKTFQGQATVTAGALNGNLSLVMPHGFDSHRIVLEQEEADYSYIDSGVYLTPNFSLEYTDFDIPSGFNTTLVGTIKFNNANLATYIKTSYTDTKNSDGSYTFYSQEFETDGKTSVSFSDISCDLEYREGKSPYNRQLFVDMVNAINASYTSNSDTLLASDCVTVSFTVKVQEGS